MERELGAARRIRVNGRQGRARGRVLRQRGERQVPLPDVVRDDDAELERHRVRSQVPRHRRVRPRPGPHQVGHRLLAPDLQQHRHQT